MTGTHEMMMLATVTTWASPDTDGTYASTMLATIIVMIDAPAMSWDTRCVRTACWTELHPIATVRAAAATRMIHCDRKIARCDAAVCSGGTFP